MRRWGWVLMIGVLVVTTFFGCSPSSDTGPPPVTEYDRTSADNLLKFFAQAYKEKDLTDYDDALDEDFFFQFTPDIADSLGLPPEEPWWGKSEDVNSTRLMFENPNVTDIAFSYESVGEWEDHVEVREDTTFSGLFRRYDPLIEVTVIIESDDDPILKLRVDDSWLDVTVVPDRLTNGLWTILRIEESKKQH